MYGSFQSFGRLSALALRFWHWAYGPSQWHDHLWSKEKRNVDLLLYVREQLHYIILLYMICKITPLPHPSYP